MDEESLLTVLKQGPKMLPPEELCLRTLLKNVEALMKRMEIQNDGSMDYQYTIKHYAAPLYRKRASPEAIMPRFLRCELNNLLFSQKARG